MSLLGDIVKAIPHAAHLQDKVREFEAKYAALETENAILKDDNRALTTKVQKLEAEVASLKDEIKKLTQPDSLPDEQVRILAYLADEDTLHFRDSMAIELQLKHARLDYLLEKLREHEYISWFGGSSAGEAVRYSLTPKGRDYLFRNDLI